MRDAISQTCVRRVSLSWLFMKMQAEGRELLLFLQGHNRFCHYCGGRALLYTRKSLHLCQAKLIFSKSGIHTATPTYRQLIWVKMQLQLRKDLLSFWLNALFALHQQFCFIEGHMAYYSKYPVATGNDNSSDLWHKNKCLLKRGKTSVGIIAHLKQLSTG